MSILNDLKPLADILLEKGAPLLASVLLGPLGGTVASAIVPQLAQAFGLSPGASASDVAQAVAKDDSAADKIATVQAEHSDLIDWAQKALDANQAALVLEPSFWGRLFVGGWRSGMGWVGTLATAYQIVAPALGLASIAFDIYATTMATWAGLAGVRGIEAVKGVARTSLATSRVK